MEPVSGTLQFILLASAVIIGIVWAIDIPTTKWFGFKKPPIPSLLSILQRINGIPPIGTDETKPPARTYTEAIKRMQERETTRTKR